MLFRRDTRPLDGFDLAKGRLRLDRLGRNGAGSTFFPCRRCRHSSRGKKASPRDAGVSPPPSSALLRPVPGASSIAFGLWIAIEAAMVAGSKTAKEK
jgi:hypothetical protein